MSLFVSEDKHNLKMAIFPAVLVGNLPRHLQQNTKKTANVLLGQDRQEMMFWRLHRDAPNFLVVFRDRGERDTFLNNDLLQEVRNQDWQFFEDNLSAQVLSREGAEAKPCFYCKVFLL